MRSIFEQSPIRIPVKLIDEKWEYFYGGGLPIKAGTIGDLIIDKSSITDKNFLDQLKRPSKHKIFGTDTELLVALTIKQPVMLPAELYKYLKPLGEQGPALGDAYFYTLRSPYTMFVSVTISDPTEQQKKNDPDAEGGVWLHLEGLQAKGITSSTVQLPQEVSATPAVSLNHAFTLLSEKYEPWRKSHTGNIYDRMLYQEKNNKWYPLNVLRNAAIAQEEHLLIREHWAQIAKALNFNMPTG